MNIHKNIFSKINIYKSQFKISNNFNLIFNRSISNLNNDENLPKNRKEKLELQRKYEKRAATVTKIGAVSNILLAGSKSSVGYLVGSTGLMADGVNSLGDLLCDAVVYYTLTEARKGVSKENPWGRGKVEPIGALTVSGLLLATGIGIGYAAIEGIYEVVPYFHSIDTDVITQVAEETKNVVSDAGYKGAMLLSGLSLFVKEYLFRINLETGTQLKSSTMIANAWQHRADVGVSAGVFLGLGGSLMGYLLLDPLAGLFVAGVIVKQSVSTGMEALKDLSDSSADIDEVQDLSNSCLQVPGIKSIEAIQARRSGPFLYVEVTVGVPGNISASAAHRLAELTKSMLMEKYHGRVANAIVHVDPLGSQGLGEKSPSNCDHDSLSKEVAKALKSIKSITGVSDVQVYYKDNGMIYLKVDVNMLPDMTIRQAHLVAVDARLAIMNSISGVADVDIDLELEERDVDREFHFNNKKK